MTTSTGTELRLALAMRGGVSLAVWIGGACAEIDKVRRATPEPGSDGAAPFWSRLLASSGYDRVVVDVLTGASAGGLNGVLYAASQVYDVEFERIRPIWLAVGGIEQLVRRSDEPPSDGDPSVPAADSRDRYFPSLLRGDSYFQAQVRERLREVIEDAVAAKGGDASAPPVTVDLRLSATSVEPIERPVASPADELLTERRFGSGFHFRHSPLPWERSDFRSTPDAPIDAERLERLALAARATSSFPVAFEAAFLAAGRPARFGAAGGTDLRDVFLDRRADGDGFYVSDGGVLDNIPLGRALDAVAAAPADSPTRRVLVYLQPGLATPRASAGTAPTTDGTPRPVAARRSTVAVLAGAAAARIGSETINADIAQLEAHNAAVLDAVAIRRGTFTPLVAAGPAASARLRAEAEREAGDYRQHRADQDARLIRDLLADPCRALGEDRFPSSVGGTPVPDARWRSPLAGWSGAAREALPVTLRRAFAERTGDPLLLGVRPLARVGEVLLEWARHLEGECKRRADDPTTTDPDREAASTTLRAVGEQKAALYRVLGVVDSFLERPRRLAWVAAVARWSELRLEVLTAAAQQAPAAAPAPSIPASEVDGVVRSVQRAVNRLCVVDPATIDDVRAWIRGAADGSTLSGRLATLEEAIDVVARQERWDDGPPAGWSDLRVALAEELERVGGLLHGLVPARMAVSEGFEATMVVEAAPGELVHRVLSTAARSPAGGLERQTLSDLEVVCFREYAAGLPGRRPIDFVRLSSANPTPLAPRFDRLLAEARQQGLWWDPANTEARDQQGIHVNLKLAGNELANFSAFLLESWRANDWLWGRMDAVPTLVELLVRPEELRRRFPSAAAVAAAFEPLVSARTPTDGQSGTWAGEASIAQELEDLFLLPVDDPRCRTASIAGLRRALVAARQWELLAGEPRAEAPSPLPTEAAAAPADPELVGYVGRYAVGAESVRRHPRSAELVERFGELGSAAARAVVWNTSNNGRRDVELPTWSRRLLLRATPRVTRMAATRFLAPAGTERSFAWRGAVALAVAAAVVLAVLGLVMDVRAFLLGLLIGLGLVVVLGGVLWGWLRKVLAPPEPGQPG